MRSTPIYEVHAVKYAHLPRKAWEVQINPDPHDDNDCGPYKRMLDELFATTPIRFVLDLHGARGDRDFMVAVGTMSGESCQIPAFQSSLVFTCRNLGYEVKSTCWCGPIRQKLLVKFNVSL